MPPRLVSDRILVDLFPMVGRSPGRHVSSAIYRIMETLHPDRFSSSDPIDQVRALLGNAVEKSIIAELQRRYPGRYVVPGELEHDGIHGTPDLWDLQEQAVVEIKTTWASSRRAEDVEDEWFIRYWWQGKSYAVMSGFNKVILIIVFIVGNWKEAKPEAFEWEWSFTDEELDETWRMIKSYARKK